MNSIVKYFTSQRGIALCVIVATIALLLFEYTSTTLSASEVRIQSEKTFLYAKPAVVRIGASISGKVRYPGLKLVEDENGNVGIVTTDEVFEDAVTSGWTCSGFIIHPSGYIVTNAHCVDGSTENVSNYAWSQFSYGLLATLQASFPEASVTKVGQIEIENLRDQILNFISKEGVIDNLTYWPTVFDPNKSEGSIQEFIDKGFQVEVKKMGQSYPQYGKDVAVIKINKENLVTVKLGDSRAVRPGSRVYVMGFPAVADLNEKGYLEPSFTGGVVSAVKKSSEGDYNVIQIDAAISGGNSGGPVFNENGEVIGIATFGAAETQGYNWILPIELAQEFLREINVQNTSGIIDERYRQGVDYFLAGRYSKANQEFETVQGLYPNQIVAQLITKSNEAIAKGEERSSFPIPIPMSLTLVVGVGAAVLVLIGGGYYLFIRSRRKLTEAPPRPRPQSSQTLSRHQILSLPKGYRPPLRPCR